MTRNVLMVVMVLVCASLAVGQVLPPPKSGEQKAGEKQSVTFETSDGVKIAADYYAPNVRAGEKAPVAILIHMFPADRTSWEPLVPKLTEAGFAVLAYDIRGKGGSVEPASKNLAKRYQDQDRSLFNEAWKDAEAAKKWLAAQPSCDVNRIAMIGASIGCSISLDYGRRDKAVKAIVCLSPGTDYFGVDSITHIRKCGKRAILLMSPRIEYETVEKLIKASRGVAKGEEYPGGREQHGTGMLNSPSGDKVKRHIVEFVKEALDTKGPGSKDDESEKP